MFNQFLNVGVEHRILITHVFPNLAFILLKIGKDCFTRSTFWQCRRELFLDGRQPIAHKIIMRLAQVTQNNFRFQISEPLHVWIFRITVQLQQSKETLTVHLMFQTDFPNGLFTKPQWNGKLVQHKQQIKVVVQQIYHFGIHCNGFDIDSNCHATEN